MLLELAPWPTTAWLLALAATAALTDLRTGLIPNWLTLPSLALAPLAQLFAAGPGACGGALVGALACALVPLLLFGLDAIGGGDVKLFAALGALAGTRIGLEIQLLGYMLASVWALCGLAYRGALWATLVRALGVLLSPLRRERSSLEAMNAVRLGLPILAATVLLLSAELAGLAL
jgi:prepilin peptidase CpaA